MVSFSNADGAHYDSVNSQVTVQSKTLQMDVKIPLQPLLLTYYGWGPYWGHMN